MKGLIKATIVAGAFVCIFLTSCSKEESEITQVTKISRSGGTTLGTTSDDNPKKIKGKIRSTTGSHVIEDADVYLYDETGTTLIAQTVSDANGDFEMDSIFIGDYDLDVHASGYQNADLEITVPLEGEVYDIGNIYMEE